MGRCGALLSLGGLTPCWPDCVSTFREHLLKPVWGLELISTLERLWGMWSMIMLSIICQRPLLLCEEWWESLFLPSSETCLLWWSPHVSDKTLHSCADWSPLDVLLWVGPSFPSSYSWNWLSQARGSSGLKPECGKTPQDSLILLSWGWSLLVWPSVILGSNAQMGKCYTTSGHRFVSYKVQGMSSPEEPAL